MKSLSSRAFFASISIVVCLLCLPSASQDGLQLFREMQNALGGADKIAAIRDYEQIVHADAWDFSGDPMGVVRKRVRFVRPSYLRVDQVGQRDTYVLYFDGKSGWEILPDGTVADLKGDELTFARNYLYTFDLNVWLADRDSRYAVGSPAPNVVLITAKDSSFAGTEITLDPASFLPIKDAPARRSDANRPSSDETRFHKWQIVGGVKFPGLIVKMHNGKKLAEISVDQTKVNQGLKASDLAVKPQDLKPAMH